MICLQSRWRSQKQTAAKETDRLQEQKVEKGTEKAAKTADRETGGAAAVIGKVAGAAFEMVSEKVTDVALEFLSGKKDTEKKAERK